MGRLELFTPEAIVFAGALLAFVLSVVGVSYRVNWIVATAMSAAACLASILCVSSVGEPFFAGIYKVDAFSQSLKIAMTAGLFLTLLASGDLGSYRERAKVDTPIFLMLSTLGMMMMVSATELLTLYVALELSAYGLYILSALHRKQREGSEAATKYILFGAASSAVSLYGISLIFGGTASTYIAQIAAEPMSPIVLLGIVMTLAGVLFKLGVVPFHAWAPDTYQGAPHQAATFIATVSKVAAVGVIIRVLMLARADTAALTTTLLVLCVASMTIGNFAAIVQKDMKRLLGYSAVAHAGYILIGLLCFSQLGVASAIYYVMVYVPIAFCPFLVISVLGNDGSNPGKSALAGLYHRSPLLALTMLVGMFGLAGIPPTAGFAGKWFLFSAAIESGHFWLVIIAAVNATVSLYYYLRVIKEAYLTPAEDNRPLQISPAVVVAAWLAIALVILSGSYPRPIWELAEAAAQVVVG